ncbi:MAG: BTAD domain-containing putative transcriptional regulator, partial [Pseudonocardiaceae bacterium]
GTNSTGSPAKPGKRVLRVICRRLPTYGEPLRDRLRGQLMVALYRSGRRAEALAAYRMGQDRSIEAFGLDPGPELQELERKILRDDPVLLAGESEPPPTRAGIPQRAPIPVLPPIVRAKLAAPVPRKLVPRAGLVEQLTGGPSRKLTLICAAAGWGKSSLLADWHAHNSERRLFCWLSLDRADNDPIRFWNHLIEALRTAAPKIGEIALDCLGVLGVDMIQVTLPWLLNETRIVQDCVTLVLDDYHLITNSDIHEQLTFLLEYLPPALEIAIATRSRPPLPLARLRARGEFLEIGPAQLRFTAAEMDALITDVLGLGLRQGDVSRLWRHMEGWAAGLYLGAQAIERYPDHSATAEVFDDHRHVFDYLTAEVLDPQPAVVRNFLLQTSILECMCGPLCDAVTGTSGSSQMLDTLERSNLFVAPLDRAGGWYRYHRASSAIRARLASASSA